MSDSSIEICFDKFDRESEIICLFFSGAIPKKESYNFYKISDNIDCSPIFLMQRNRHYYQQDDYSLILSELNTKIQQKKHNKIVFVGSSMGSYGAMLFSQFILPSKIIMFVPQFEYLTDYNINIPQGLRAKNLLPYLNKNIELVSYTCKNSTWESDIIDTNKLKNTIKKAKINWCDCDTHSIAKYLHKNNLLIDILKKEII